MRKYLKPAFEMEEFDLEDVITLSGTTGIGTSGTGSAGGDGDPNLDDAAAPIDLVNIN